MFPTDWLNFFATLASVSAAILAIAFVTFQIKIEVWRRDFLRHLIAIRTLGEFLVPMFFSLLTLMPDHNWQLAGTVLGSIACIFVAFYHLVGFTRWSHLDRFNKVQLIGSFVMYVEFGAILYFSTIAPNLTFVSYILIWLIMSGSGEAWWFLAPTKEANQQLPINPLVSLNGVESNHVQPRKQEANSVVASSNQRRRKTRV